MKSTDVAVLGMQGLGDSIYQRAFVKRLSVREPGRVFVETPWPELLEDLAVRFLEPAPRVRTQLKNVRAQSGERWTPRARGWGKVIRVRYNGMREHVDGNIVRALESCFGMPPLAFDLPNFPLFHRDRRIAIVRPVTERREWLNTARNPLPAYVAFVAADLMADYHVISVADLEEGAEWLVGDPPPAHERLHHGQLPAPLLLGLVRSASVIVGGPGWIVPAAIAAHVPCFVINGGQGGTNSKERLTDPRMKLDLIRFAEPDRFCRCAEMRHECDKRNTKLGAQWAAFRKDLAL